MKTSKHVPSIFTTTGEKKKKKKRREERKNQRCFVFKLSSDNSDWTDYMLHISYSKFNNKKKGIRTTSNICRQNILSTEGLGEQRKINKWTIEVKIKQFKWNQRQADENIKTTASHPHEHNQAFVLASLWMIKIISMMVIKDDPKISSQN